MQQLFYKLRIIFFRDLLIGHMDKIGLLKMAVRITYPENSLTPEEQQGFGCSRGSRTLYFYDFDTAEGYAAIMAKAWRPGALATTYHYIEIEQGESIKADRRRGEWLPLDAPFREPVSEKTPENKRDKRHVFY